MKDRDVFSVPGSRASVPPTPGSAVARTGRLAACAVGIVCAVLPALASGCTGSVPAHDPPVVEANDNRRAAGARRGDTLFVDLEVRMGRWYPEAPDGPYLDAPVLAEVGHSPRVPGPLIRVAEGTIIAARLTNALADSVVTWLGLTARPGLDSLRLRPGETRTVRFAAGQPGTYLYTAQVGRVDWAVREREQTIGAFIVDARGTRTDDRVFVMNVWGEPVDSATYRNALAINGRGWPYTERVHATRGDTLRWRIVNGTNRPHPMHLHGFYYRILSTGDGTRDSIWAPRERPEVVTELMLPFSTMTMEWTAEREGHWLFHCHLSFHVEPASRFTSGVNHDDHTSGDVARHMAGLVLAIDVQPGRATPREDRSHARAMRLLVQEGSRRGRAPRTLGFVLQRGAPPAPDSVEIPGTTLFLTRDQPTDITVVNHLGEATAVHWHGIELESYSDGVAGWSGAMNRLAPSIAPGDSFTARLTLRRAGTFIYHTHLNDVEQLTSGLYGAIVVVEPGRAYDPRADHVIVVGWDGPEDPPHLLVNGDSLPQPRALAAGVHHRLRFIFIGAVNGEEFTLQSKQGQVLRWRSVARDGFELPAAQQREGPSRVTGWAGQTFDFDFLPPGPGEYALIAGDPAKPLWVGRVLVSGGNR